jgi:hypothetical protein
MSWVYKCLRACIEKRIYVTLIPSTLFDWLKFAVKIIEPLTDVALRWFKRIIPRGVIESQGYLVNFKKILYTRYQLIFYFTMGIKKPENSCFQVSCHIISSRILPDPSKPDPSTVYLISSQNTSPMPTIPDPAPTFHARPVHSLLI